MMPQDGQIVILKGRKFRIISTLIYPDVFYIDRGGRSPTRLKISDFVFDGQVWREKEFENDLLK